MYLPDRDYWIDVHSDVADAEFTSSERRNAFGWCHSLIEDPRPQPSVRNISDSEFFDMDVYYAWLPGTDIETHWMVDDANSVVYVVDISRPRPPRQVSRSTEG